MCILCQDLLWAVGQEKENINSKNLLTRFKAQFKMMTEEKDHNAVQNESATEHQSGT